ncbi:MAG: hypothetical protein EOS25_13920 [Mesorhizobium sp.]|uniref:hypothetical protein n=1 Tax=Mesorhizobium sp. TaxID=1871066 RepID=UPI000FE9896C|nr:hypothetical protein [Mesorhizobium sp.]RWD51234.1 MAG: hypothetical protein EOS59_06505 [Mesorhizobium sp.]RWE60074.1 MAG: hypothetical protein EOS24_13280 [Mesorhizobium sp.]RWF11529.1 MAG: hypothetical protein EOS69_08800 [Mesorhizobium sp.]RWF18427.1 MAG: hypothetical protein EOS25_13920 [Mesorhizobium sp.]TIY05655.1 MAG: hypothetical protein E5V22_06535 [Mesorhizobium sp.]
MERIRVEKRRRVMTEFAISELSAVDRPAQQHARMTIMKRDDADRENVLKLTHRPMTGTEQDHYAKCAARLAASSCLPITTAACA